MKLSDLYKLAERFYTVAKIRDLPGANFDMQKFKQRNDPRSVLDYVAPRLEMLGHGSSRISYLLNSQEILKVALNPAGIAQNLKEVELSNSELSPIFARVFDYHPEGYWIRAQLVRHFRPSDSIFLEVPYRSKSQFSDLDSDEAKMESPTAHTNFYNVSGESFSDLRGNTFISELLNKAFDKGLVSGDVFRLDHWGQTPDGRAVLLDYGLTREVYDSYYDEGIPLEKDFSNLPLQGQPDIAPPDEDYFQQVGEGQATR